MRWAALFVLLGLLVGCTWPRALQPADRGSAADPRLATDYVVMPDGYRLPLRRWSTAPKPTRVLLGLHGFNDYSHSFAPIAQELAKKDITTYAVDQRGFGAARLAGRWHGSQVMAADLKILIQLLRRRHPHARLYVAGESMGGAVAMLADATTDLPIDGLILIAPAVWSRDTMPWYQRLALQVAEHTVPWMTLTGKGIHLRPTDNQALLQAMSTDPLVIKETRVDALWGITNLMDAARRAAPRLRKPILLLYGEHDEIIPRNAFCDLLDDLPTHGNRIRLVLYRNGWHMLPRDLQGARVRADILAWILDPDARLPSGEEAPIHGDRIKAFCSADSFAAQRHTRLGTDQKHERVSKTMP